MVASGICVCRYPLKIIDKRDEDGDGKNGIEHISIPLSVIDNEMGGQAILPIIEEDIEIDGRKYTAVLWRELDHDNVKTYDVRDHIVIAGCEKEELQCDAKSIYSVFHPSEEWRKVHIVVLENEKEKKEK